MSNIREPQHERPLSTRTSNSRGETGSTTAYVTLLHCVTYVTSVLDYGYAACCFDSVFFIFAISQILAFFKTGRDIFFQCYTLKDCFQLLEECTARNPEFPHDRFGLTDMDNSCYYSYQRY